VDRPEPRVTQRSHRSANLQQVLEDELLLALGRLCQPVHQALGILEPPTDFFAEA
jgi:hypothetical protein